MKKISFNRLSINVIFVLITIFCNVQVNANSKEINILFDFIGSWHSNADTFGQPAKSTIKFSQKLKNQFVQIDLKILSMASKEKKQKNMVALAIS